MLEWLPLSAAISSPIPKRHVSFSIPYYEFGFGVAKSNQLSTSWLKGDVIASQWSNSNCQIVCLITPSWSDVPSHNPSAKRILLYESFHIMFVLQNFHRIGSSWSGPHIPIWSHKVILGQGMTTKKSLKKKHAKYKRQYFWTPFFRFEHFTTKMEQKNPL